MPWNWHSVCMAITSWITRCQWSYDFDKVWPRHCLSALLCKICISPKVTKNNFIGIFYVLVYSMFKLEWWEEIQWRNGDFVALLRWRSGRAFDKNVPNIFCQKVTFFDQRPVFNELFSKSRTFWVFLRPIDRNMWKKYFFRNIFLDNIFLLTSCGPPTCRRCGSTRLATGDI